MDQSLQLTVQKLVISALLLTTLTDLIKGFSLDIFVPLINKILPGDIASPISLFGINFYFTRFFIRMINALCAIAAVHYIQTTANYTI